MSSEIWVEKYRPTKLEDVVANPDTLTKFNQFLSEKNIPHLLFSGTAGIGKTTVAKILSSSISEDVLYINASDKNSVEVIRGQVSTFCSTMSFSESIKIIILDEFDGISDQAQKMLRGVTEEFAKRCRFILTCNFDNKILDAIKSRCQQFEFGGSVAAMKREVAKRCLYILNEEGITYTAESKKCIGRLVSNNYPDIRKTINVLQQSCCNGEFVYDESVAITEDIDILIDYLKECNIKAIRKELLGAGADYKNFYKALFNRAGEYVEDPSSKMSVMLIIGEYMNYHTTTIDTEINFVTCLLQICKVK